MAVSTECGVPSVKIPKPKRSTPVLKVTAEERARQFKTDLHAMLKANLAKQGPTTYNFHDRHCPYWWFVLSIYSAPSDCHC